MRNSIKVFHECLDIQLAAKFFCLETFMVYGGTENDIFKICKP